MLFCLIYKLFYCSFIKIHSIVFASKSNKHSYIQTFAFKILVRIKCRRLCYRVLNCDKLWKKNRVLFLISLPLAASAATISRSSLENCLFFLDKGYRSLFWRSWLTYKIYLSAIATLFCKEWCVLQGRSTLFYCIINIVFAAHSM